MRLVTYSTGGSAARIGAVDGESIVDLQSAYARSLERAGDPCAAELAALRIPADMTRFIGGLEPSWAAAEEALRFARENDGARLPLADARLHAPLMPPIILNSGQNYWDHRDEKPQVDQQDPEFFLKAPLAVIGPDEPVIHDPVVTKKLDYEVELAVVIGKPGRHIPKGEALEHVFRLHGRKRHHGP
jgi:2-keto-4-pentenoate hydratase/2-oxohepta-3-ene-1,7-dioic acid hydratase in catechol pathway